MELLLVILYLISGVPVMAQTFDLYYALKYRLAQIDPSMPPLPVIDEILRKDLSPWTRAEQVCLNYHNHADRVKCLSILHILYYADAAHRTMDPPSNTLPMILFRDPGICPLEYWNPLVLIEKYYGEAHPTAMRLLGRVQAKINSIFNLQPSLAEEGPGGNEDLRQFDANVVGELRKILPQLQQQQQQQQSKVTRSQSSKRSATSKGSPGNPPPEKKRKVIDHSGQVSSMQSVEAPKRKGQPPRVTLSAGSRGTNPRHATISTTVSAGTMDISPAVEDITIMTHMPVLKPGQQHDTSKLPSWAIHDVLLQQLNVALTIIQDWTKIFNSREDLREHFKITYDALWYLFLSDGNLSNWVNLSNHDLLMAIDQARKLFYREASEDPLAPMSQLLNALFKQIDFDRIFSTANTTGVGVATSILNTPWVMLLDLNRADILIFLYHLTSGPPLGLYYCIGGTESTFKELSQSHPTNNQQRVREVMERANLCFFRWVNDLKDSHFQIYDT